MILRNLAMIAMAVTTQAYKPVLVLHGISGSADQVILLILPDGRAARIYSTKFLNPRPT